MRELEQTSGLMTCQRCRGTDHLVTGDGPLVVCRDCIDLLCHAISEPWACSERLLGELLEQHSGSVKLARTASPPHELVWEWIT